MIIFFTVVTVCKNKLLAIAIQLDAFNIFSCFQDFNEV